LNIFGLYFSYNVNKSLDIGWGMWSNRYMETQTITTDPHEICPATGETHYWEFPIVGDREDKTQDASCADCYIVLDYDERDHHDGPDTYYEYYN